MTTTSLTHTTLDPAAGLRRESPRPTALRNADYERQFDWNTLFYDVYRVGDHVVLQGPPYFNLLAPLLRSSPFDRMWKGWFSRLRHIERNKRGEIWLPWQENELVLDGPIGLYRLNVQPDMADLFAGKRVLHTLSKDNAPRWIHDWIQFYRAEHGADAVLLYDNGSTAYAAAELEADLGRAFPDMVVRVIDWPFKYGPQGGLAGAVGGIEAPWDSDFCQTGSLQHARHRFLRKAASVLNVDIDEMVLPGHERAPSDRSIFAATEQSAGRFIKFPGQWISGASPHALLPETCRHADFLHRDLTETRVCPPKWCIVPAAHDPFRTSWSVHNLFGSPHNRFVDEQFGYRHMTAISTSWKEKRWETGMFDPSKFEEDTALREAFARAKLPVSA